MSVDDHGISLHLQHPLLSAKQITDAIGVEPKWSHDIGDQRSSADATQLLGPHKLTQWVFHIGDFDGSNISVGIAAANAFLRPHEVFLIAFNSSGGVIEYYVSAEFGERFFAALSPALLSECSTLCVTIEIEAWKRPPNHASRI